MSEPVRVVTFVRHALPLVAAQMAPALWHAEWEAMEAAADRVTDGIERHHSPRLIVGTHGMVLTAWLVCRGALQPGAAALEFWEDLAFPDIVNVSVSATGLVQFISP